MLKSWLCSGRVISGLDHGIASMKLGEVATFYISPSHAYGNAGYLEVIAPGETLVVGITLFDWRSWLISYCFYDLASLWTDFRLCFRHLFELRGARERR